MFPSTYPDEGARQLLNEWRPEHNGPLVQIQAPANAVGNELQSVSGD
jgi:hypothetical protein